jgi:3-hydroxybutyryl-CoA dehydrogenase
MKAVNQEARTVPLDWTVCGTVVNNAHRSHRPVGENQANMNNENQIRNIAVIGAGIMGRGIAQVAAVAGYNVTLHDTTDELLSSAIGIIKENLTKGIVRGKVTEAERDSALATIGMSADLASSMADADLVIEAIVEDLSVKQKLFRELERSSRAHAILATNTSSLSIGEIASATSDSTRVIGMHFFNPAYIMRLLEIVVTGQTSETAINVAREVGRRMKKEVIVVRDSPGFATSRLGICLGLEAMRMVEDGVASPADIDRAMELGYNHPMGPLRLGDLVGLDIRLGVAEYLHGKLGERFRPPELLRQMVAEGKLGRKTGRGFYVWEE